MIILKNPCFFETKCMDISNYPRNGITDYYSVVKPFTNPATELMSSTITLPALA